MGWEKRLLPKMEMCVSKTEVTLWSLRQVVHYLMIGHGQTSWHYEIIRSTGDDATVTFTNGLVQ